MSPVLTRGGAGPYPGRVLRRLLRIAAVTTLLAGMVAPARAVAAHPSGPTTAPPPPPPPKAWIVVDGDSGAVIAGSHERDPLPVASVFKMLTALLAVQNLPPDTPVPVSEHAAGMPARKINLKAGQTWAAGDLLHALLLVSANDAAVALAERMAGDDAGFVRLMEDEAQRIGLADHPVMRDPAGLDDEFSYDGGNRVSARDLAIVTRDALAVPVIATIVAMPVYRFDGGDGNPHRLLNHNLLLKTYPGAIGVKTGYTKRAGHTLIAAARRDGRTMIAVVLDAPDPYRSAAALLDQGFAAPIAGLADLDHLPEVVVATVPTRAPTLAGAGDDPGARRPSRVETVAAHASADPAGRAWWAAEPVRSGALALAGGAPALVLLVRRRRRPRIEAGAPAEP